MYRHTNSSLKEGNMLTKNENKKRSVETGEGIKAGPKAFW